MFFSNDNNERAGYDHKLEHIEEVDAQEGNRRNREEGGVVQPSLILRLT